MRRLKILTWHTHGSYLYYLSHAPHDFYLVSRPGRPAGYGGRCGSLPWGENVFDQPCATLKGRSFDCVLYQDDPHYLDDRYQLLDVSQRKLPAIYVEHDPPREHPTDTRHPVDDPSMLLVHVTAFNALMWDNGRTPTRVIEHGVTAPDRLWVGDLDRGITVINHLARRGRRLGSDLFLHARSQLPLDLLGLGSEAMGGLGELPLQQMAARCARYRFLFHPARYTSLGLSVIEAMMMGMPVVALATTEMPSVIDDGVQGHIATDVQQLIGHMQALLADRQLAVDLGRQARLRAMERFSIERFAADWDRTLREVAG